MKTRRASDHRASKKLRANGLMSRRLSIIVIVSSVIVVALALSGFFLYRSLTSPFRQAVLTIDDTVIRMDYFLKRAKMADDEPTATLEQLTYEQIVKDEAPGYGIEVTELEIEAVLQSRASVTSGGIAGAATPQATTEAASSSFEEWYSQELGTTGLSDAEYREIVRINLLAAGLRDYLASQIATEGEQIHLNVMALATYWDAEEAKARVLAGETFAVVASEVSVDSMSKSSSGDLGWIPRGVVPYDDVVFELELDQISDPVMTDPSNPATTQYALFLVSEKESSRDIDAYMMQVLSYRTFYEWLAQEKANRAIEYHISAETQEWIEEQLAKAE